MLVCICNWKHVKNYKIETVPYCYKYEPLLVTGNNNITILWDFSLQSDTTIKENRLGIITIKDEIDIKCKSISMSIPSDKNILAREFEKLSKYKELEIETEKLWHF